MSGERRRAMAPPLVEVLVRLHGPLSDLAAARELRLSLPDGSRLAEIWTYLAEVTPAVTTYERQCAVARNGAWARGDDVLADADEVDLIPPVSGG